MLAEDGDVASWSHECLVAAAIFVVNILSDDLPVVDVEDLTTKDLISVSEAIQDEPNAFLLALVQVKCGGIQTHE